MSNHHTLLRLESSQLFVNNSVDGAFYEIEHGIRLCTELLQQPNNNASERVEERHKSLSKLKFMTGVFYKDLTHSSESMMNDRNKIMQIIQPVNKAILFDALIQNIDINPSPDLSHLFRICNNLIKIDFFISSGKPTDNNNNNNENLINLLEETDLNKITKKYSEMLNQEIKLTTCESFLKLHLYVVEGWAYSRVSDAYPINANVLNALSEVLNELFTTLILGKKQIWEFRTISIREVLMLINQYIGKLNDARYFTFFFGSFVQLLLNGPGSEGDEYFFRTFHEIVQRYFRNVQSLELSKRSFSSSETLNVQLFKWADALEDVVERKMYGKLIDESVLIDLKNKLISLANSG